MAEWSKALAWKVSIRQKRIEGSNPSRSAISANVRVRSRSQSVDFSGIHSLRVNGEVRTRSRAFGHFHGIRHGISIDAYGIGGRRAD